LGGAIPGILVGLAQCSVIFFLGRKKKYPLIKESYSFHDIVIIILTSIPFLLMPIIIIGGIISGFFTPTEASAVAVAYGFILTIIAKKGMVRIKELLPIFTRSSVVSASILMLAAASNVFGWILATEKIPEMLTRAVLNVTQNRYIILLIINCFLLMWGMFMDSTPAIFILEPILFPLGVSVGMDPIHFGVVMGFNLVIGLITPPYGVALFTGTIVSGIPMEKLIKELIPFISASIAILLLITYVPEIVMFLPKLFKLHI
jgi:C4-dicarboxylate transporter DctM subunit